MCDMCDYNTKLTVMSLQNSNSKQKRNSPKSLLPRDYDEWDQWVIFLSLSAVFRRKNPLFKKHRKALADSQWKYHCSSREHHLHYFLMYWCLFLRFDVEKECARIDGNVVKQSPAFINTAHPQMKTQVDASCNVSYSVSYSVFNFQLNWIQLCMCLCV